MPEAPELAIVREVLENRLVGAEIVSARVLRPTVVRSLSAEDITQDLPGRVPRGCQPLRQDAHSRPDGRGSHSRHPNADRHSSISGPIDAPCKVGLPWPALLHGG